MSDVLQHYGIRGMKWGVRRFQQKDGSLTSQGRKRYGGEEKRPWERRQPQESFLPLIW